jgi:hypothetical protein
MFTMWNAKVAALLLATDHPCKWTRNGNRQKLAEKQQNFFSAASLLLAKVPAWFAAGQRLIDGLSGKSSRPWNREKTHLFAAHGGYL